MKDNSFIEMVGRDIDNMVKEIEFLRATVRDLLTRVEVLEKGSQDSLGYACGPTQP
jgi:hypothetical protein